MNSFVQSLRGAACATREGADLFGRLEMANIGRCREICAGCPVRQPCAQWAIRHENHGMWGGMIKEELEAERRRHGIRLVDPRAGLRVKPAKSPEQIAVQLYAKGRTLAQIETATGLGRDRILAALDRAATEYYRHPNTPAPPNPARRAL